MKHSYLTMALVAVLLLTGAGVEAKKLHTIGDSTMQTYDESTDKRGWGQMLQQFFEEAKITVNNRGKSGASSKSFYKESAYWPTLKVGGSDQMQSGDILVIQFAHNDEKSNGTDGDEENALHQQLGDGQNIDYRGTTPFGTYKEYLRRYINEAKAMGVKPILVAPIARKYFTGGTAIRRSGQHDLGDKFNKIENGVLLKDQSIPASDHTMDYVWQMEQVAMEYPDVPFINMNEATVNLYLSYGESYCTSHIFCQDDNTHPAAMGATLIARLFAQLVRDAVADPAISDARKAVLQELDSAIVLSSEISFSPASGNLGKTYTGQSMNKEFNVSAFGLTPAEGTVTFTSTGGYLVSTDKVNYSTTASASYTGSTLIAPLYVRYQASTPGVKTGSITASNGSASSTLDLTLEVGTLGGEAFTVLYPLNSNTDAVVEVIDASAAAGETFSNMEVQSYKAIDTGKESMQHIQISGQAADGSWPGNEIDEVSTRYVQFAFQCPEERKLTITKLGLHIAGRGGNALCAKVYYSTDATFSTNTQIFEYSKMTNKQVYPIEADAAVTLEEGERLYIRVYPWLISSSPITGKWLCIDSVYISGQAESTSGVEINGNISYEFIEEEPTFDPETMLAGFAGKSLNPGAMEISGRQTFQEVKNGEIQGTYTKVSNNSGTNFASTPDANNTMVFTLTPDDGFYFTPTRISFDIFKHGTSNGSVTAIVSAGSQSQTLCENVTVTRQQTSTAITTINETVSGVVATTDQPLKLAVSFLSLPTSKFGGMGHLVIEGTLQGAASSATKYVLTTEVTPAGAGSISLNPELGSYKEGSLVSLAATKNFGYAFSEWQDGDGNTLSNDAAYTITMDADKTVKAVFSPVPVYTVTTTCTNEANRELGNITLVPNEHEGQYEAGTVLTAKVKENTILTFLNWTDNEENNDAGTIRTLTVNSDMELVANMEVSDFVAIFDASRVQGYACNTTYPFEADQTWDEQRNATSKIVKLSDGTPLVGVNGTPVVRNREQVVLVGLNGLYQNGYNTTEIAWQYQFSTVGFTALHIEAEMAAKNAATKAWKAQYSVDGTTYIDITGATWNVASNTIVPISFNLPEECEEQAMVYVRLMGVGTELFTDIYPFDKTAADGMSYCDHSESGFGNLFVLGTYSNTLTECENVTDDVHVEKILRNGQIVIVKNGIHYSVLGEKL